MQPRLRAPPHVTALAGDLGCCVPVHQAVMHGAAGEDYNVEHSGEGPRPFSAVLDTGLHRTSTGSKVFACLKVCAPPQGTRQGQTCWGRAQVFRGLHLGCMLSRVCGPLAAPGLLLAGRGHTPGLSTPCCAATAAAPMCVHAHFQSGPGS